MPLENFVTLLNTSELLSHTVYLFYVLLYNLSPRPLIGYGIQSVRFFLYTRGIHWWTNLKWNFQFIHPSIYLSHQFISLYIYTGILVYIHSMHLLPVVSTYLFLNQFIHPSSIYPSNNKLISKLNIN